MSNQVTGRLVYIGQPQEIPSKSGGNPFVKREFILDATTHDPYTGERSQYENILPLEVSGDKCAELDQFRTGDVITVSFALQGREWTNQDGQVKRMVSTAAINWRQEDLYNRLHRRSNPFNQRYSLHRNRHTNSSRRL